MSILSNEFPECQLYGCTIVDSFPRRCPLEAENPLDALLAMKNAAFAATRENTNESSHLFRLLDTCDGCISRNLTHPTVKRLRQEPVQPAKLMEDVIVEEERESRWNDRNTSSVKGGSVTRCDRASTNGKRSWKQRHHPRKVTIVG